MADVSFYDQFELLEMLRDDGVKSFRAKEIATGRNVEAHIFVNPNAPLSVALLSRLNKLPASERERIVHRGKNQGTPYVITTPLADFAGLREWLSAKRPAANVQGEETPRAEFTRLSPLREAALETVPRDRPLRDFTRISVKQQASRPAPVSREPRPGEPLPPSGEFARMALIKSGVIPGGIIGAGLQQALTQSRDSLPLAERPVVVPIPVVPSVEIAPPPAPPVEAAPVVEAPVAVFDVPVPVEKAQAPAPETPVPVVEPPAPIPEPVAMKAAPAIQPSPTAGWPPPPIQANDTPVSTSVQWIAPAANHTPPPASDWKTQLPLYLSLALSTLALLLVLLMFFTRR